MHFYSKIISNAFYNKIISDIFFEQNYFQYIFIVKIISNAFL